MQNTISIIIPLFNRETLIIETLKSVQIQTFKDFECLIIDDHSTDNSYQIVKSYILGDNRFVLKKRINPIRGAPSCRNEGIDLASNKYIMFLDSDDLLDPQCLEQRLNLIKKFKKKNFYIFNVALFNHENYIAEYLCADINSTNDLEGFIKYTGGWQIPSSVFNRKFLKGNLYFDEEALSWQDVEFHIRALLKTKNYLKFICSDPDVYIRIGNHNRISNSKWSYHKIFQRITTISKIEKSLLIGNEENYENQIFLFYFRYLEIGARTLNLSEYSNLKNFFKLENQLRSKLKFQMFRYLDLQNFLYRKNHRQIGSILFRILRVFYSKKLAFPQKKILLDNPINIKTRYKEYY